MIPLEQQVTSLGLSKRLKELEVKQDGLYSYFQYDKYNILLRETKEIFAPNNECGCNKDNLICSAFTVTELGEMLPAFYTTWRTARSWFCWDELNIHGGKGHEAKTEADTRAKMLIHLIENKLVEAKAK